MPIAVHRDVEIAYEEFGEGEPLLLVMGLGSQMLFWPERFCRQLVELGFRVIRFDNRDVGLSSWMRHLPAPDHRAVLARFALGLPIDAPYTLSDMAGDAVALLDHLGIERAHVAGASMGGMIVQRMALEHPQRVLTMTSIMSGTGDRREFPHPRAVRALLRPAPRSPEKAVEHILENFRILGSQRWPLDERVYRPIARAVIERGVNPSGYVRQLTAICAAPSRRRALAAIEVPTLVIHGTDDALLPARAGRATAAAIPGAGYVLVEGMGHDLPPQIWPRVVRGIRAVADSARGPRRIRSPGRKVRRRGGAGFPLDVLASRHSCEPELPDTLSGPRFPSIAAADGAWWGSRGM